MQNTIYLYISIVYTGGTYVRCYNAVSVHVHTYVGVRELPRHKYSHQREHFWNEKGTCSLFTVLLQNNCTGKWPKRHGYILRCDIFIWTRILERAILINAFGSGQCLVM